MIKIEKSPYGTLSLPLGLQSGSNLIYYINATLSIIVVMILLQSRTLRTDVNSVNSIYPI